MASLRMSLIITFPFNAIPDVFTISIAERRAFINDEKTTQVWLSDLSGIIPSITGKIELVYEGEQEGPYQVAFNLLEKAIRTQFAHYFPNPDTLKKKKGKELPENPYKAITRWFDAGNNINIFLDTKDSDKLALLNKVDGLHALVKSTFGSANENEKGLLMEFVLHGLSSYSLISKKMFEGKIEFKDLMGSMFNFKNSNTEEGFDDTDYN
jgi:magnesium chelatase subunit I